MKLHLHDNQSFQILQITDLHLKDYPWNHADEKTLIYIKETVARYRPDLVIFTGDMIWTTLSNQPLVSYQQFITFCQNLAVPIAITYGNHDTNHPDVSRQILREMELQIDLLVEKQQVMIAEERESYIIPIYDEQKETMKYALFVLDSGGYNTQYDGRYDWILPEQIQWFNQCSKALLEQGEVQETLVFQHIPLPEYFEAYYQQKPRNAVTEEFFRVDGPSLNTGFFAQLIFDPLATTLFVGHNHNNNFDVNYRDFRLVFGQVSGFGANAMVNRGARLIRLTSQGVQSEIIEF